MTTPELQPKLTDDNETPEPMEPVTPTWFASTYPQTKPEDMAARYAASRENRQPPLVQSVAPTQQTEAYEAYRRRLEDRFQVAKKQVEEMAETPGTPTPRKPRASHAVTSGSAEEFRQWQDGLQVRQGNTQRPVPRRPSAVRIASLLLVACSIGGAAGYGSSKVTSLPEVFAKVAASGNAVLAYMPGGDVKTDIPPLPAPLKTETVISKKVVRMARVDVQDTKGTLNGPIPLNIVAFPSDEATPLALRITGIPQDAYLTRGVEITNGEWLLKSGDVANVQLVVPHAEIAQVDLAVAAIEEKTGLAAAPPRELTVDLDLGAATVVPANAAPESQSARVPQPLETTSGEARVLIGKGETLMTSGDVVSARQFFVKAHGLGAAEAAYWVGQTYDPMVYERMNVRGLTPDAAKAKAWYEKAAAAGSSEAQTALQSLLSVLQP